MGKPRKQNEIIWLSKEVAFVDVSTKKHPDAITVLDIADLPFVLDGQGRWYAVENDGNTYAARRSKTDSRAPRELLHRVVTQVEPGFIVDHKSGNGLDNTRRNLRAASPAQNAVNRKSHRGSTSRYLGVSWRTRSSCWVAQRRGRCIGYYQTETEAARAYDMAAAGDSFARLNRA